MPYPSEKPGVDDRSEQFGTDLYHNEIEPILTRYFAAKMRASMRADDQSERNQEALDLLSEAKVLTLKKLGSGGAIDDLSAYVRTIAANIFNQHLRRRHPHRLRVKNQCRYLLTHDPRYAIWRDDLEAVRELIVKHPNLLHESAGIRNNNWGPPMSYAANLGREVLLISAVTGEGLSTLVGRVSQMLADIRRIEKEEADRQRPTEFATEPAIRTEDFRTRPTPEGRP